MTNQYSLPPSGDRLPKYGLLLLVLCLLIIFAPTATATGSTVLVEALFNLVLIVGTYSGVWGGVRRWPFLTLTALTFIARWCALVWGGVELEIIAAAFTVGWTALVIVIVLGELFEDHGVTTSAITKAIVTYLLIAIAFAYLYELLELSHPGSFSGVPEEAGSGPLGDALLYFSLVSLTTLGYGDIVPVSSLARPVAALEGAVGTLYIAVIIARLVAVHVASMPGQGSAGVNGH
jgi:hypothetical protein